VTDANVAILCPVCLRQTTRCLREKLQTRLFRTPLVAGVQLYTVNHKKRQGIHVNDNRVLSGAFRRTFRIRR